MPHTRTRYYQLTFLRGLTTYPGPGFCLCYFDLPSWQTGGRHPGRVYLGDEKTESKYPQNTQYDPELRSHEVNAADNALAFLSFVSLLRLPLLPADEYPHWQHSFSLRAFYQAHTLFPDGMERPVNIYPEHFVESSSMGLAVCPWISNLPHLNISFFNL